MKKDNKFWIKLIYLISISISLIVAFLILGPRPKGLDGAIDVSILPTINALLNGTTFLLLVYGYIQIKKKHRNRHRLVMSLSFVTSTLFLVSYVIYHWFKSGPKSYTGDFSVMYYFILITHVFLAALIIPLALFTLYRALISELRAHKKIARITLPIWLYVSVTGVVIYWMLYF